MAKGKQVSVMVDATLVWPFLTTKSARSGKFQVDVSRLSDEDVAKLEGIGIEVRDEPKSKPSYDHGKFVTCKSNYPITAYWTDRTELTGDELAVIGNGTTARVQIGAYAWTYQGDQGVSANIVGLVIRKLVEYEGGALDLSDDLFADLDEGEEVAAPSEDDGDELVV